jgi:4-diphosphocytidyl-2-C-methyl-D-erythritol kinase
LSSRRITVRAPAKINLTLEVRGRRADGYHELDSVMMALELGDELVAEIDAELGGAGCTLALRGPAAAGVPGDATNLALRGARAVREVAAARGLRPVGVRLTLTKHVPAQAGLGGGSADAAAAAFACARLFGLDPDDPELLAALAELGSDCVFFLAARQTGLARCTGRGERVEPLAPLVLPWSLVLVTPDFGCSTTAVYRAFVPPERPERRRPFDPQALGAAGLEEARARLVNELEPAAERVSPELKAFRAHLEQHAPGAFRLAGSGSSCFGFFADDASARNALARLHRASGGRRYALRGQWVLPAQSRGLDPSTSSAH